MFEPIWNRNHIDHIQITVDEKLGVGHRGSFYDATGAISQRPCFSLPRRAAKQASESKAGQHSQSIEPSRPTRAAVSQSPISA